MQALMASYLLRGVGVSVNEEAAVLNDVPLSPPLDIPAAQSASVHASRPALASRKTSMQRVSASARRLRRTSCEQWWIWALRCRCPATRMRRWRC